MPKVFVMSSPPVAAEKLTLAMEVEMRQSWASVMAAVNGAPMERESLAATSVSASYRPSFAAECLSSPCGCGSRWRTPLFPPPREVETGNRLANKGRR